MESFNKDKMYIGAKQLPNKKRDKLAIRQQLIDRKTNTQRKVCRITN